MLRPKTKIISIPFLGLNKKVDPLQLNEKYFFDVRNVDFTLNGIKKRPGYKFLCQQNEPIIRFCNYDFVQGEYLLGFTKTKLLRYNANSNIFEQVGTASYSETDYISFDTGFGSVFFTNNIDRVKYWNFSMQNFEDVPGLDDAEPGGINVTRAKSVCVFENFLILANTQENGENYPTRVRWSRYRDYSVWKNDEDGTGMAGYIDFNSEPSEIVAIVPLRDLLVVFKTDCVYVMKFVGSPFVFVTEKVLDDIGLIAPLGYTILLDSIVFVGNDNIYSFNGSSVSPIGDVVFEYFLNTFDRNKSNYLRMFSDVANKKVYLFYPEQNKEYCSLGLVFNLELKSWTLYDIVLYDIAKTELSYSWTWQEITDRWDEINKSWAETQTILNEFVIFSSENKVFFLGDGGDFETIGMFYVITKIFSFDNLLQVKRLFEVNFIGTNLNYLKLTVYYGDEPYLLNNSQVFYSDTTGKIQCDISAKFFQFKIETIGDINFSINSIYFRFSERGLR